MILEKQLRQSQIYIKNIRTLIAMKSSSTSNIHMLTHKGTIVTHP